MRKKGKFAILWNEVSLKVLLFRRNLVSQFLYLFSKYLRLPIIYSKKIFQKFSKDFMPLYLDSKSPQGKRESRYYSR